MLLRLLAWAFLCSAIYTLQPGAFAVQNDADSVADDCNVIFDSSKRNLILNDPNNDLLLTQDFAAFFQSIEPRKDLNWVLANLFFDRDAISLSLNRESNQLTDLWDEPKFIFFKKSPLTDFQAGFQKYILDPGTRSKPLTQSLIMEFHTQLMRRGFEGMEEKDVGRFRTVQTYFRPLTSHITALRFQFESYPYLRLGKTEGEFTAVEYPPANEVPAFLTKALEEHEKNIASGMTKEDRLRVHTDFVWKFISIHPFVNGNGRTSRFILDYLLAQEDLPPPILSDTLDVVNTPARFYEKVVEGMKTTQALVDDLKWRKSQGLDFRKTPYNLSSKLPRVVWMSSESLRGRKEPFAVDLYDYVQFVRDQSNSKTAKTYTKETDRLRDYVAWVKKWSVHFKTSNGDFDAVQIRRIPQEMMDLWSMPTPTLQTAEGLRVFYKNFYEPSRLYRGLSLNRTMSDQELIKYFTEVQGIDLSMNAGRSKNIKAAVLGDYQKFNQLMEDPEQLFRYVTDHMNAEGLYSESIFNSTAKVSNVADRFSRGFMMSPNWIKNMKGQLLVSALRPKYGVMDLNRLREISSKVIASPFKSEFPRQQEVSVAGVLLPASMMTVEFRDVIVNEAVQNSSEWIAGDTTIQMRRVLERLESDPSKIKLSKYDGAGNLLSEQVVSLY